MFERGNAKNAIDRVLRFVAERTPLNTLQSVAPGLLDRLGRIDAGDDKLKSGCNGKPPRHAASPAPTDL